MANRYSNITTSQFDPMSFQEIMFAPSAMRQQHNASIAAAEAMRIKADPLDVHNARALELKNQMDSRISGEVDRLNTEGFNPNSTQNITKLNREYQDLIAPTGEVGKINAAKQVYNANLKEYLDDATKNKGWSRERALNNWQNKFANKYTGFDEDGKEIVNIGQYGAPKKIEVFDKLKDAKSLLGSQVVNEMRASGYSFQQGPEGSMVMVDRSGRRIETSNKPNLQSALSLLQSQFNEREWSDSRDFEGADNNSVARQVIDGVNSMLETKVVDNRGENAQYIAPRESKEGDIETDLDAVNVEAVNIGKSADMLTKMEAKDTNLPTGFSGGTGGASAQGRPTSAAEIKNKFLDSQDYLRLARSVARTQKINKNLKDPEVQAAVTEYLRNNKDVTIQNRYVDANAKKTDLLFASRENVKDKKAASNLIMERAARGAYEVVDAEGNKIEASDLGKYTLTYNGDMTAKSQVYNTKNKQPLFRNPKQNIGLRTGVLTDKDGNNTTVYISRGSDDFKTPQFKAMEIINKLTKLVDTQPNIYHSIKAPFFDSLNMKNVAIRYNNNEDNYDMSYTDKNGKPQVAVNISSEQFQRDVLNSSNSIYGGNN